MAKRKLSILQKAFREFFLAILSEYNVNSPGKLTKEQKSAFFTRIREEWKVKKAALLSVNIAKRSISKKNSEQTDNLKINFYPNHFLINKNIITILL